MILKRNFLIKKIFFRYMERNMKFLLIYIYMYYDFCSHKVEYVIISFKFI